MEILYLIIGLVIGGVIAWLIAGRRHSPEAAEFQNKFIESDRQCGILNERLSQTTSQMQTVTAMLENERKRIIELNNELSRQQTITLHLTEKLDNERKDLEKLQQRFTTEFENLSAKILEEKSKKFTEQNRLNLDIILAPLREKIQSFEQKVEQSYKIESAERNTLKGEIKNLIDLNRQISEEAGNLAKALKGDTKKQGNWGEIILERILERSGLNKGSEYQLQYSTNNIEGQRIRPDVIIYLPDNKHVIIDSKVSLVAYEAMVSSQDDELREKFLKDHIASVKNHVKHLSEKGYETSASLNTPDFVLLFMPIESSFGMAVQADNELFSYAWDRKIVIVSPTTLLATLKTINSIWKQEKQTRNALEIARQSGALYDKFAGFLKDFDDIKLRLDGAKKSYDSALGKLSEGPGNIIRKIEEIKKLGAKTEKSLPQAFVNNADEES